MNTVKKAQYRQRVYSMPDPAGGPVQIILVFGEDPAPVGDVTLLADHDVTELVTSVDHVVTPPVP